MSKLIQFAKQHKLTIYKAQRDQFIVDLPIGYMIDPDLHHIACFTEQEVYDRIGNGSAIKSCTTLDCELCHDQLDMTDEEYAEWMDWELLYSPNPTKSDYNGTH